MSEELDWFDGELKLCECEDVSWQSPIFSSNSLLYLPNNTNIIFQSNNYDIHPQNNNQQYKTSNINNSSYNNSSNTTINSHNNTSNTTINSYNNTSNTNNNIMGTLILTNFRLRFIPHNWCISGRACSTNISTDNLLLKKYDVVLYNIESIYKVKKKKRKQLNTGCLLKKKVSMLEIVCKTFQVVTLAFEALQEDDLELKMVYTLLEAVKDANLHPFLAYAGHDDDDDGDHDGFFQDDAHNTGAYWQGLLNKGGSSKYRVVSCNESFHVTDSLPKFFVVPSSLSARHVIENAPKFVHNRFPFWSYSHPPTQTSLIRMAFKVASVQEDVEDKIYKSIQASHPSKQPPDIYNLNSLFPSYNDIKHTFLALQAFCVHDTTKDAPSDNKWLSQMEASNWLSLVATCLRTAQNVATTMSLHQLSVVVKELNSSVLSPLISCLVQLMLDPSTRHRRVFEEMIAREWLWLSARFAYKHQSSPFSPPCNSLSEVDAFQFPVFLLFLDCVYQLTTMAPTLFSFNSTYLQSLWTSVCCGLYRDLLFNSPKEMYYNKVNKHSFNRVNPGRQAGQNVMGTLMRRSQIDVGTLRKSKKEGFSPTFPTNSNNSKLDKKNPTKHSLISLNSPRPTPPIRKQSLMTLSSPDPSFLFTEHTKYSQCDLFGTQATHLASKLWCWSFMFEEVQLGAFESIPYLASRCSKVGLVRKIDAVNHLKSKTANKRYHFKPPLSPKNHHKPPLSPKHHYKPPLPPKSPLNGFKFYNDCSLAQSITFSFLHLNFSQPFLTFWADCYLKHNPLYHYNHHTSTHKPSSISPPQSDLSDEYHVINRLRTRIFLLEKCL